MIDSNWFPWDDQGELKFQISGLTQKDRMELLRGAEVQGKKWLRQKSGSIWDSMDMQKYNELLIQKVVKGCEGLKNKHLLEIYDCTDKQDLWEFKIDKKSETLIDFDKNELSKCFSSNFIEFLNAAINAIDDFNRKSKADELKN